MKNLILLLASIAILPQVDGEIPNSISCTPKQCYTAFEIRASFQTAVDMCEKIDGHLMSVRYSASNDAMGELLRDAEGEFWIGLQFNGNGCTDTSRLRRYVWITGDTLTNFTNWSDGDSEPFCAPTCVSVSRDLKWKGRSCDKIMDGFLCEHDRTKVCAPLEPRETDESVHYITPFGNEGEGPTMLPMGSVVTGRPSGVKHICTPDGVWLRAPWSCEVLNGGCEHKCVTKTPQCTCPAGTALQRNNITCTPNDACVNLGCEQLCLAGACLCRDGYELLADGKGCRDKDECRDTMICPNSNCVNTIVTPTSNYTKDVTSAVTAGGLLGITVCVVLMILIIVFLAHQISRRRSSWNIACMLKSPGEDLQDLQQVTTQKYTKKSSFVNRNVKQDT
ncbi:thrombomodulin-like [Conger conger]|uniref:thrombomodulin-like n=1 Tax=Conger conger TaxID=82655 RepID=UPI002A5B0BA4|nr:thrombomodulin-like [Conger conger]